MPRITARANYPDEAWTRLSRLLRKRRHDLNLNQVQVAALGGPAVAVLKDIEAPDNPDASEAGRQRGLKKMTSMRPSTWTAIESTYRLAQGAVALILQDTAGELTLADLAIDQPGEVVSGEFRPRGGKTIVDPALARLASLDHFDEEERAGLVAGLEKIVQVYVDQAASENLRRRSVSGRPNGRAERISA